MARGIGIAIAALLSGIINASAQDALESRGAWRIVADGEDFALRTQAASAADTSFALKCLREPRVYAFEIKSPALAAIPQGEDLRVGYKVDDDEQTWFSLAAGRNGTVPIAHQTAFWIIHAALVRTGANTVAFTAADYTWQFPLDGFADLTEGLAKRCGFEPPRGSQRR